MGLISAIWPRNKRMQEKGSMKFGARTARVSVSRIPTAPRAASTEMTVFSSATGKEGFLSPRCTDPFLLYPFFRYLRDYIPDVSAGVWAWVRLCATPQQVEYVGGSDEAVSGAKDVVAALDARIYEFDHMKHQGMDALVNAFFLSVFTYGSFAGEVVLKDDRSGIDRFYSIDPASVRFRRIGKSRRLVPYQFTRDNKEIRLNEGSFFYYGLDADADNPYGRSPLLAVPFVAKIQQQLIEDMGRAMHNAGWPTLHVRYKPPEREPGESFAEYQERVTNNYNTIRENLTEKEADSNYITYDNVEIDYLNPAAQVTQRWSLSLQAVSEQVISALHLAPFMLGRNWGTTETWGRAQYQLIVNNAVSVQRGAKRMCEWLRDLELALAGSRVTTRHHFEPHSALSSLDAARARSLDVTSALKLEERGILQRDEVRRLLEGWAFS
jgi:hypothetical protein